MSFKRISDINSYNECKSPVCKDNTEIRVIFYPSRVFINDSFCIFWTVDSNSTDTITSNKVVYNFDNSNTILEEYSVRSSSPYKSIISNINNIGIINFKIKCVKGGTVFESSIYSIIVENCNREDGYVQAELCNSIYYNTPLESKIWVYSKHCLQFSNGDGGIIPIYFKYGDYGMFIPDDALDRLLTVAPSGPNDIIVSSVRNDFLDCNDMEEFII